MRELSKRTYPRSRSRVTDSRVIVEYSYDDDGVIMSVVAINSSSCVASVVVVVVGSSVIDVDGGVDNEVWTCSRAWSEGGVELSLKKA